MEKIKNRVHFQERIENSIERIPFIKKFITKYPEGGFILDINKMNKYMKKVKNWEILTNYHSKSSHHINLILQEAERRGDL